MDTSYLQQPLMYVLAGGVIAFVIIQSLFFMRKAWKRGKELGMSKETLKSAVTSSVIFTIAPAIAILATVVALSKALGLILPWIRLSVIGNLAYETAAAETTLSQFGGSISNLITDPVQFSAVAWVMTLGSCAPLILMPILCKKVHKTVGNVTSNKNSKIGKLADYISAAAFIGIISAFVCNSIYSGSKDPAKIANNTTGFLSIATLIVAILLTLLLETICKKFKLEKVEPFVMPIAMFGAMGCAILFTAVLPPELVNHVWIK